MAGSFAEIAQSVEHSTENAGVPSSSLGLGTTTPDNWPPEGIVRLAMGDRLTAGLRTLDPSIGVRIPVPQPAPGQELPAPVFMYWQLVLAGWRL